ncbi:MAG: hypothetical protein R6X07_06590 [Desulfatiglandales bacterium]|jgi:hypothetical protein
MMSRFGKRDVTDIIEFLEKELDAVPRLEKVEKMKLRSKLRQQENWLIAAEDPKPDKVLIKLEGRLAEIFRLYPHGFKEKLVELLEMKTSRLERNAPA